jgi:hypothetical protein
MFDILEIGFAPENITDGVANHKTYKCIMSEQIPGRTIEGIGVGSVPGTYGQELVTYLLFTDGTCHGFVQPSDIL